MATYTGKDFKVTWAGTDITSKVLANTSFAKEGKIEDVTPFGVVDQAWAAGLLNMNKELPIEGLYDDTPATGSDALFNQVGTSATLLLTIGGTSPVKTISVTAIIKSYERIFKVGSPTRFKAVLQPAGVVTET